MSLILEALKKSEQERRRDKGPDLQTIHQPIAAAAPPRSRTAVWLGALLAVNAIGFSVWWWQQRAPVTAQPPLAMNTPAAVPAPAAEVAPAQPLAPAQSVPAAPPAAERSAAALQGTAAQDAAEFTRFAPAPESAPAAARSSAASAPPKDISELPDSVRNSLPAMTFSFHVYSADPHKRTIIINNRRLREGEAIDAGVTLQEITEDGVIVAMNDHRIHISVLSGW